MASTTDILRELRRQVAAAICAAQEIRRSRTPLQRMCYALLLDALGALDIESHLPEPFVIRIAAHALVEWRRHESMGLAILDGGAANGQS
jgi:hypothetical protein